MTGELKPCPFCGKPAELLDRRDTYIGDWLIGCVDDQCAGAGQSYDFSDEAIAAWNRRATLSPGDDHG